MQPQLFRIDDRLIHGQIVIGWAKSLKSNCILLCDDDISGSSWEKDLYLTCVSDDLKALVLSVKETCEYINNGNESIDRTIILVKSPGVVQDLIKCGFKPEIINVGGLHFMGSRKEYLPYLYLDQSEIKGFTNLLNQKISIYCQDVPTGKKYKIQDIIAQ
jgi:mannose/fructose/N-acetylgalactosamine-specific phosphotransferase system component IIB